MMDNPLNKVLCSGGGSAEGKREGRWREGEGERGREGG